MWVQRVGGPTCRSARERGELRGRFDSKSRGAERGRGVALHHSYSTTASQELTTLLQLNLLYTTISTTALRLHPRLRALTLSPSLSSVKLPRFVPPSSTSSHSRSLLVQVSRLHLSVALHHPITSSTRYILRLSPTSFTALSRVQTNPRSRSFDFGGLQRVVGGHQS